MKVLFAAKHSSTAPDCHSRGRATDGFGCDGDAEIFGFLLISLHSLLPRQESGSQALPSVGGLRLWFGVNAANSFVFTFMAASQGIEVRSGRGETLAWRLL